MFLDLTPRLPILSLLSGFILLPVCGFSEALSEEDRETAIQLVSVSFQCMAPAVKSEISSSITTNRFTVDGTIVRVEINEKIFETYPEDQYPGFSGEEYEQDSVVFFDYSHIETIEQVPGGLTVSCKEGRHCLAVKSYTGEHCPVTNDGFKMCGNISVNADQPPTGESNFQFTGLCSANIGDAAFGLQVLVSGGLPAANGAFEQSESFRVGDAYSEYAVPIRMEPDIHSGTVGAVPPDSGIIRLARCREVEGYQSEWCEVSWGGVSGWISKKKFVPAQ